MPKGFEICETLKIPVRKIRVLLRNPKLSPFKELSASL
jgi:hypothetical protein